VRTFKLKHFESDALRVSKAVIVLSEYSIDEGRNICLTSECRSIDEMRAEVQRLKNELDAILDQASSRQLR
jgi:hypothetical protein